MHKVTIIWGGCAEEKQTYSFKTYEEMDAFRYGVSEGYDWFDYSVIEHDEEGNPITDEEEE